MNKKEIVSERIKKAMSMRGISAADLSAKSGVSGPSISQYVNAKHAPDNITAGKLAEVLKVSPIWLMGFENVPMYDVSIPEAQAEAARINTFAATIEENKRILEKANLEFSKKYLTNDSMEVLAAYHDADQTVKNMIRKMLDLPSLEEKKESSAS